MTFLSERYFFDCFKYSKEIPKFYFVLGSLVLYVLASVIKKVKIIRFAWKHKGPTFFPFIGSAYAMIGENILPKFIKLKSKYSLPCNLWIGHEYNYITDIPGEIKILLNHQDSFEKAKFYGDLPKILFGDTLLMTPYEKWKPQRKHLNRSFSPQAFKTFIPVFYDKSCELKEKLFGSKSVDIYALSDLCIQTTFDSLADNLLGWKNVCRESKNDFIYCLERLHLLLSRRSLIGRIIPHYLWTLCTQEGRNFLKLHNTMKKIVFKIVRERRKDLEENNVKYDFVDNAKNIKLLDAFILDGRLKFSDSDIFSQMHFLTTAFEAPSTGGGMNHKARPVISIANNRWRVRLFLKLIEESTYMGIDTTGGALVFTFLLLGMHPEVQDKLYEEIMEHVGADREIEHDDLARLKYTERVIKESLRILPTIPITGRYIARDINLGKKTIPKGSNVAICPYLIHRNEKYWKDPEKFDPDRFSPENVGNIVPGSYVPFLIGGRDCLGKYYALDALKVMVTNVVRNFEIRSNGKSIEDFKLMAYVSLKPYGDIQCTFTPRTLNLRNC